MTWSILRRFGLFASLCLAAFIVGCSGGSKAPDIAPQDPTWSSIISAHTAGQISRKSNIRVVFVNDIVGKDRVGQSANGVLKTSPSIDGNATFASAREIVLVPTEDLAQSKYYVVTVENEDLLGIPKTLDQYEFTFQVLSQQFEVNVDSLDTGANDKEMVLRGSVISADVDDADKVEKIVGAKYRDKALAVSWQHNADGHNHDFTVTGIERDNATQILTLSWDGDPINVDTTGTRDIEVPGRNIFKVTGIQALHDERQHIQIQFSDTIDPKQNLKGFIRTSAGSFGMRIEGNTVDLYASQVVEGDVVVTVEPGMRNARGDKLEKQESQTVTFVSEKPKVRFVGAGVILPEADRLTVPIETVNARSVQVTAFRVYENNMGQFLQTNKLDGQQELGRVGRYLWRKTIRLTAPQANRWNRYSLDVTSLFKDNPGGLFRLTVSIGKTNAIYNCPGGQTDDVADVEPPLTNNEDLDYRDVSSWDYAEDYYNQNDEDSKWQKREDPCAKAYYKYNAGVRGARNFLASNIGLVAKRDQRNKLFIVATDLRSAKPLRGVKLTVMSFQNQAIGGGETGGDGLAQIKLTSAPFYLLAEKDGQKGYLKLSQGTALPVSHFDVGGEKITSGIKGFIYGERGVWRPGDDIHLTFMLQDKDNNLPANHPVTMELYNPKNQMLYTLTNATPVGGFYHFMFKTPDDALTGDWTAKAVLGGNTFTKNVKVETVMPNRLRVELDFGDKTVLKSSESLSGKLFGQWLSGATASGLKADVKVKLTPTSTKFDRMNDFVFDDPTRDFDSQPETVFEGELDASGNASVKRTLGAGNTAAGMLTASFTSRIFERGGAFSVSRTALPFAPYDHFLGMKLPKGDQTRNMLLTDKMHAVEIASLNADGKPVALKNIQVSLYKIEWRWWWDKSGDSLAQFATSSHSSIVHQGEMATDKEGRGKWEFEVKYPAWGRYLVRACDTDGGHCTGRVFYIDWPGWAGRAQEQAGPGANALTFTADKEQYNVGETAVLQLPEATTGRALVTVENGTTVIDQQWIEFEKERTTFKLPIKQSMSPNVFVSVTLLQPHADKKNDRPIRLYGVIPVKVNDPTTRLEPIVKAAEEWAPEADVTIQVSEKSGRAMTYTLAIVDEGLLGLTGFRTPDPHSHFYKREALGVTTWDLFDDVVGAYGGELERLLALGGSDDAPLDREAAQDKKRFPPVVQFLGPFELGKGDSTTHKLRLPQYVGAVRVMVVAGKDAAYGSANKSVFVRQPLMILPTVPRVVGPDEELTVPVSMFVMDPSIKQVTLKIEPDERFEIVGGNTVNVAFDKPDEKIGLLKLKVRSGLGKGLLRFSATSGKHLAKAQIYIDVRSPNPSTVEAVRKTLKPGESWEANVAPHGIPGTNVVTLEISAVPPLDLERRLGYLIRYPHGCLEQTISAAFPQLYLPTLVKLEDTRKKEVDTNVNAAIDKLRGFQVQNGGFVYWPGGFSDNTFDARNSWTTSYVGHFLIEAERLGYSLPPNMLTEWAKFQKSRAVAWTAGAARNEIDQAYRLYTLALAKQPEVGAMNRLRENARLIGAARWYLAASYQLAGMKDVAAELVKTARTDIPDYATPDETFSSPLRDAAIILSAAVVMERDDIVKSLVERVSADLISDHWHSTHSLSFSLMAMAKFVGSSDVNAFSFEQQVSGGKSESIKVKAPVLSQTLRGVPDRGAVVKVKNTSGGTLFAMIATRGVAKQGQETAATSGLTLDVSYTTADGDAIDVSRLKQGQDFVAYLTVTNKSEVKIDNVALTQIVPSGWEIHNARLAGEEETVESSGVERGPRSWWSAYLDNGSGAPEAELDYLDIRDDRIHRYFSLKPGENKRFRTMLNAAYLGKFYLAGVSVEAMYDASKNARVIGRWAEVVVAGQ